MSSMNKKLTLLTPSTTLKDSDSFRNFTISLFTTPDLKRHSVSPAIMKGTTNRTASTTNASPAFTGNPVTMPSLALTTINPHLVLLFGIPPASKETIVLFNSLSSIKPYKTSNSQKNQKGKFYQTSAYSTLWEKRQAKGGTATSWKPSWGDLWKSCLQLQWQCSLQYHWRTVWGLFNLQ